MWKGEILLLSLPDQRSAVDLVADPLLHHIPSVELQTWVHCLHSHRCQVSLGLGVCCWPAPINWNQTLSFFQLCWSASWEEASVWFRRTVPTWDRSLFGEGKTSPDLLLLFFTVLNQTLIWNVNLCARPRSCTWTSAPRWTLRVTETVAPVLYPPTAPGNLPTQCCRTRHVSHPLLQKALSHSAAGQYVPKSCSHNRIRRAVVSFVRNLRGIFF